MFKNSLKITGMFVIFVFLFSSQVQACRFYIAVGERVPSKMIKAHLLEYPNSLKNLGRRYEDGWSIGSYENNKPKITRGMKSSLDDEGYDQAVKDLSADRPNIVIGHLRRASSGCVEGVKNPHPFVREKNGKKWIFGHNGWINKELLENLIGDKYLEENKPTTCTYDPPESWIDSELFFIFLMKKIEDHEFNVEAGIIDALIVLSRMLPDDQRKLNFFLSDGQTVWVFRKGTSLFYAQDHTLGLWAVASTFPDERKGPWEVFPEDRLAVMTVKEEIRFIPLLNYWNKFHDFEK